LGSGTRCAGRPSRSCRTSPRGSRASPGRILRAQFIRYLGLAKASAGELRAQLYVALDAGYLAQERFAALTDEAQKCSAQLSRFIEYLKANPDVRRIKEDSIEYEV
jgi:four helix bundle protein